MYVNGTVLNEPLTTYILIDFFPIFILFVSSAVFLYKLKSSTRQTKPAESAVYAPNQNCCCCINIYFCSTDANDVLDYQKFTL